MIKISSLIVFIIFTLKLNSQNAFHTIIELDTIYRIDECFNPDIVNTSRLQLIPESDKYNYGFSYLNKDEKSIRILLSEKQSKQLLFKTIDIPDTILNQKSYVTFQRAKACCMYNKLYCFLNSYLCVFDIYTGSCIWYKNNQYQGIDYLLMDISKRMIYAIEFNNQPYTSKAEVHSFDTSSNTFKKIVEIPTNETVLNYVRPSSFFVSHQGTITFYLPSLSKKYIINLESKSVTSVDLVLSTDIPNETFSLKKRLKKGAENYHFYYPRLLQAYALDSLHDLLRISLPGRDNPLKLSFRYLIYNYKTDSFTSYIDYPITDSLQIMSKRNFRMHSNSNIWCFWSNQQFYIMRLEKEMPANRHSFTYRDFYLTQNDYKKKNALYIYRATVLPSGL